MSLKPPTRARLMFYTVAACVALVAVFALAPRESERYWRTAADIDQATLISVPRTATRIHLHSYTRWVEYVRILKFSDDVENCLEHARLVTGDNEGRSIADESPVWKAQFDRMAERLGVEFEIDHGRVFGHGGSMKPTVWVDTKKGVFYYFISD